MRYKAIAFLMVLMVVLWAFTLIACGNGSKASSNTMINSGGTGTSGSNTGGGGTSSGSGSGSSSGGSSGSVGGVSSAQLTVSMETNLTDNVAGQVVIAQNGGGTMTINGAPANTTFDIQFCPFADPNEMCNSVGSATSNGSGAISTNFTMGHGGYSGVFQLMNGTTIAYISAFNVPANGSVLEAIFIRASTVNAGFGTLQNQGFGVGFDSLSSGTVTLNAPSTAHVVLNGTPPNSSYGLTWCRNFVGSACFAIGAITTDTKGNFTGDFDLSTNLGIGTGESGVFYIASGKPPAIQFVQGFTVP